MKYTITKEEFFEICQRYDLVGANIIVFDKDESVNYQYGYLDIEEQKETTINTIYRIASISKTVLAIGAMKLVEDGLLDSFDVITCNPPFFKYIESSNINKNDYKTIARHEVKLNLNQLFTIAKKLLKNKDIENHIILVL